MPSTHESHLARLRDWTRRGDLDAAADLYADAVRREASDDGRLALDVLLASGRWWIEMSVAEPCGALLMRSVRHVAITGTAMIAVACRHGRQPAAAVPSAELVATTVREILEPSTDNDCARLWHHPRELASSRQDAQIALAAVLDCPPEQPLVSRPTDRMRDAFALAERRLRAWRELAARLRTLDVHCHLDVVWFAGCHVVMGHLGGGHVFEVSGRLVTPRTRRHDQLRSPMLTPVSTPQRHLVAASYPDALTGLLGADGSEPADALTAPLVPDTEYVIVWMPAASARQAEATVRDAVRAGHQGQALCQRVVEAEPGVDRSPLSAAASIALRRQVLCSRP